MIKIVRQRMGFGADLDEVLDEEDAAIVERLRLEFHQRPIDSAVAAHIATLQNGANDLGRPTRLDRSSLVRLTAIAALIVIGLIGLLVALPETSPATLQADLATDAPRSTAPEPSDPDSPVAPGSIDPYGRVPDNQGSEPASGAAADGTTRPAGSAGGARGESDDLQRGPGGQQGDGGPIGGESSSATSRDTGADPDEGPGSPSTSRPPGGPVASGPVATSGGPGTSSGSGQATTTVASPSATAKPTTTGAPSSSSSELTTSLTTASRPLREETCNGRIATIVGTPKRDVLRGTDGADVIYGGNGNDVIYGLGGDDTICGGNGKDELHGGSGDDYLYGGNGKDVLIGGSGTDVLDGGNGPDELIPD
ncbi:MAG: hypothetical protein ACR2QO_22155 [Acidimicrobiales bacterium]